MFRPQAVLLGSLGSLGEEKQILCVQTVSTSEWSSQEGVFRDFFYVSTQVSQYNRPLKLFRIMLYLFNS